MTHVTRRSVLAGTAAVVLLLSACGTRVSDDRLTAAGSLGSTSVVAAQTGAQAADGTVPVTADSPGVPTPAAAVTTGPRAGTASGITPSAAAKPGTSSAAITTSATAADAPCTSQLAPISLGQVGAFSGFLAITLGGFRPGLAAWASEVNARGGVQCHPIRLSQRDDGSDPARTTSAVNSLVRDDKVVALLAADVVVTIAAYRSAATAAGMPTIGGDGIDPAWNTDPLMFPAGVASLNGFAGAIKAMVQNTGLKKMGIIHCVEASICGLIRDSIDDMAAKAGATVVTKQSASLTQTDYTSQCQNMKSSGAETAFTVLDSSAVQRFFKSCASIGFRPPTATTALAIAPSTAADPNVQAASVYLNSPTQPYFNTSLPVVEAFQEVMKRYAPGAPLDQNALNAYAAGKLFEAGMAKVAAQARSGPVTTKMIMEGMNSLKNEDLDGLISVPLTFKPGPHPTAPCYFVVRIDKNGLTDLSKGRPQCL